jgi:hypothetical protein
MTRSGLGGAREHAVHFTGGLTKQLPKTWQALMGLLESRLPSQAAF